MRSRLATKNVECTDVFLPFIVGGAKGTMLPKLKNIEAFFQTK